MGNNVIPENDITAENSALVPVGNNAPPSVDDNPNIVNNGQDVVPNQPTPPAPIPAPAQIPQLDPTDDDSMTSKNDSTDSQATSSDSAPASKEKKGTLVTKKLRVTQESTTSMILQMQCRKM